MKLSSYFLPTLKETPSDADTASAKLMLRAGMIRKLASGLYNWLPFGYRVLRKVENVIRTEMDAAGAFEAWLPHVQPKELWEETKRWNVYGKELLRIKDRKNNEFCFAPTAEEVITDLARRDIRSYKELPVILYQMGTKFRDEIRPRFGVMRAREFYMKDAYSFHATEEDLDKTYRMMVETYSRIFKKLGLKFRPVEADSGAIGGSSSHEFMVLAETGEEQIATCPNCDYAANVERAEIKNPDANGASPSSAAIEEVATPGKLKVEDVSAFLKVKPENLIKTVFLIADDQPVVALLRGDTDLNELKLKRVLRASFIRPAKDEEYEKTAGCPVGFAGPTHLKTRMVADPLVMNLVDAVSGAGKKDFHLKNVNPGRDFKPTDVSDIRMIQKGDPCPKCGTGVDLFRGIEVGHVFKLGTKYSESMKATFLDKDGKAAPMIMGCYGIGVSRIVAAAIEQNHDDWGIKWPLPIAPFQVLLTPTNMSHKESAKTAENLYQSLKNDGFDVLFDDRDARAGVKFKDADLIGIPVRVTIGEKSLAKGVVEIKKRGEKDALETPVKDALETIKKLLSEKA